MKKTFETLSLSDKVYIVNNTTGELLVEDPHLIARDELIIETNTMEASFKFHHDSSATIEPWTMHLNARDAYETVKSWHTQKALEYDNKLKELGKEDEKA